MQMRAEIVYHGESRIKGLLHNQFLPFPFEFNSLLQMIGKMEEIFDSKSFPEAFMTPRVFGIRTHNGKKQNGDEITIMNDNTNYKKNLEPGLSKCTFEVTVKFRQNATWQGQILWAEKNLKQNFRSALEMIKLMDEALTESSEQEEQLAWN